ncbi:MULTISPECIES: FAD-dependent oxidoreductase [unclassified Arthrobacter]|uniref:FAD-dependent oxidoreductase n=2 Tax=Arthrobacter TaxID=1663 RepID=UPI000CE31334|nr:MULTISPECIES: FAD-dependent oxidoreductase [unclassified Arthrobacter]
MTEPAADEQYDVVVVGVGAAGAAAALNAREHGARVLVIEKCPQEIAGGNTRVSGGGWFRNNSPEQAEVFLRSLNGSRTVAADVVKTWAAETAKNSDWLRGLGATVRQTGNYHTEPEFLELDGSDCYAGMDTINGEMGQSLLYEFLLAALTDRGVEIRFDTGAEDLIVEEGVVCGVRVNGPAGPALIRASGGVVLATGGFAGNPAMVQDFLPLEDYVLWGSPNNTGDGHRMAQSVGADLWHMDNMMSITGINVGKKTGIYLALWGGNNYVFVAPDGRRFIDETAANRHGHVKRNGHEELFPLSPFYLVFDESMRSAGPLSPSKDTLPVGWNLLMEKQEWSGDNSLEVANGLIQRAQTLRELAEIMGVDSDTLERTIKNYNASCEEGRDDHFGRPADTLAPVAQAPFYALRVVPLLGWSDGGPRRDGQARVLNPRGEVIEGLYVAGEASATYSWTKDGGFHIADALAFGRVAGAHAAGRAAG